MGDHQAVRALAPIQSGALFQGRSALQIAIIRGDPDAVMELAAFEAGMAVAGDVTAAASCAGRITQPVYDALTAFPAEFACFNARRWRVLGRHVALVPEHREIALHAGESAAQY